MPPSAARGEPRDADGVVRHSRGRRENDTELEVRWKLERLLAASSCATRGTVDSMVRVEQLESGGGGLCRRILSELPEWFGIPEAVDEYAERADELPCFAAYAGDEAVGLATVERGTSAAAEIHVMAVLPEHHGRGLGKRLVAAAEEYARAQGCSFLLVKTLSSRRRNAHYERTRHFYLSAGFEPLAELPELWGPENPCLLFGKYLGKAVWGARGA